MMLRAKKKKSREVSLYEPIGTDREGNEINFLDICIQEQPDIVEELEKRRRIKSLYGLLDSVLNERERQIIYARYGLLGGNEVTQKDIGKTMGISRSYVSRIEKKALEKLKSAYRQQEE